MSAENVTDEISVSAAATLIDVSAARIRQLAADGFIEIHRRGHTSIKSVARGYARFWKEQSEKTTKTASASRATDARAREIELRIAERSRELIPIDDANLALDLVVGEVNKQFTGLAARITRDVGLRRKIEAELYEAKRKIAEALAHGAELNRTGRDPTDPDADHAS